MFRALAQVPRLENMSVSLVCFLLFCIDETEGDTCVEAGLFLVDLDSTLLLDLFPALCPSTFCLEECGLAFPALLSLPVLVLLLLLEGGLPFSLSKYPSAEPFLRSTAFSWFSSFCRRNAILLSSSSCCIRLFNTSSCSASCCM